MITVTSIIGMIWPLIVVGGLLFAAIIIFVVVKGGGATEEVTEIFPYEKKPFVFDILSELTLYRLLVELYGDKYYIFPQMSYGRLIQVKKGENSRNRNRFDKKIADFVLCDKERAVAQLVIELDGASHLSDKKIERDERVDNMMAKIGLPILHLKTENMDKEFIRTEISKKLI